MSELCSTIIQATVGLLTERNAKFQCKEKPFYPSIHTHAPALFFAGTKDDDLKHAIQITTYKGSSQVSVTVFSVVLIVEDIRWLGMIVDDLNRSENLGYFVFETNPGKLQLRYIVNLQLDRRKLQHQQYIKDAVWLTVERADQQFRIVGQNLLQLIKKDKETRERIPAFRSEFYDRARDIMLKFGFSCKQSSLSLQEINLEGPNKEPGQDSCFSSGRVQITLLENRFLIVSIAFDLNVRLTPEQEDRAFLLAAQWNSKFSQNVFIIRNNSISLSVRCRFLYSNELLVIIEELFADVICDGKEAFADFNTLFQMPPYKVSSFQPNRLNSYKVQHNETMQIIYEEKLSLGGLAAEREERRAIINAGALADFFYMEGVKDQDNGVMIVRVPTQFKPFHSFQQEGVLISQSMAQQLCILLQELCSRGFYYQHLPQLLYCTGDLDKGQLKVVPWGLARHKVHGFNASLLAEVNPYMARFLKLFTASQSAISIYELIKEQSGQCLLDPAYLTCPRGCIHTAFQWWTQTHYMGRTRVSLTPVFREGMYREFHEIMTEFLKAEKCYHPRYQCRPLGLVLLPGSGRSLPDTIFLVQEAPKFSSLRTFLSTHPSDAPQLFTQLQDAVAFLHSREVSPLALSPSCIGVDFEASGYTVKLPALVLLSPSLIADTVRYLPSSTDFQVDWKRVDAESLALLQSYLERGEEPAERSVPPLDSDLPQLCTPVRAWAILHTCM